MGIVVIGAVFVDIKGFPLDAYIPTGRNAGHVQLTLPWWCKQKCGRRYSKH